MASWIKKEKNWLRVVPRERHESVPVTPPASSNVCTINPPQVITLGVVIHKPLRCPDLSCNSRDLKCQSTSARPVLYYKCKTCGKKFKVLERD